MQIQFKVAGIERDHVLIRFGDYVIAVREGDTVFLPQIIITNDETAPKIDPEEGPR